MSLPLKQAAALSFVLAVLKAIAFFLSGSVIVLGSFFDSVGDSFISLVNSRLYNLSRLDPDRQHPFGHGGYEVIGSLVQGVIILTFGFTICFQSIMQLRSRDHVELDSFMISISVLVFAAFSGFFLQSILSRAEKKLADNNERALSLSADKAHYLGDFYFNMASASGLLLVWLSGYQILDAVFGLISGLFLMNTSLPLLKKCYHDIIHSEVDVETQNKLVATVRETSQKVLGVHRLRTRFYGPILYVDFHLKLAAATSLEEAHNIGEEVSRKIKSVFPNADPMIHLDPDSEPDDDFWKPIHD